jgi:hypothetical protein
MICHLKASQAVVVLIVEVAVVAVQSYRPEQKSR